MRSSETCQPDGKGRPTRPPPMMATLKSTACGSVTMVHMAITENELENRNSKGSKENTRHR